jgi:hypothetical protein
MKLENKPLLEVTDTFNISSIGLLVVPSFDLPPNGKWESFSELVTVEHPDGSKFQLNANFSVIHLNIRDLSVGANKRWQIVCSFKGIEKSAVPAGSKIYVSTHAMLMVKGEHCK